MKKNAIPTINVTGIAPQAEKQRQIEDKIRLVYISNEGLGDAHVEFMIELYAMIKNCGAACT